MSDNTYNIPTMSTGTMAKQLTELYTQAYRNHTLPFLPSVALWGPMGVGKSTGKGDAAKGASYGNASPDAADGKCHSFKGCYPLCGRLCVPKKDAEYPRPAVQAVRFSVRIYR